MRVLVADEFSKRQLDAMRGLGLTVDFRPQLTVDTLAEAAQGASILVVRSTEVKKDVFDRGAALSLVIRAGAGVNTIDVQAASDRGVFVANCPGQNALAVAELTLGLILAVDRKLPDNVAELRRGLWDKKRFSRARGLYGRTLGLAGLGAIGRAVAERAQGFGMRVVGYSRSLDASKAKAIGIERAPDLLSLARECQVLSIHLPACNETRHVVSRAVLAALPDGATFINTSRADVVDGAALLDEAKRGRLFVATDVFEDEPKGGQGTFQSELAQLPNVYGTHHIGASTEQAQEAIAEETVHIIATFLHRGVVLSCVNIARKTAARFQLIVRHHDRVGVLARVLEDVRKAGINAQEVENTVFQGGAAACCKIALVSPPPAEVLEGIRAFEDVIFVDLVELKERTP